MSIALPLTTLLIAWVSYFHVQSWSINSQPWSSVLCYDMFVCVFVWTLHTLILHSLSTFGMEFHFTSLHFHDVCLFCLVDAMFPLWCWGLARLQIFLLASTSVASCYPANSFFASSNLLFILTFLFDVKVLYIWQQLVMVSRFLSSSVPLESLVALVALPNEGNQNTASPGSCPDWEQTRYIMYYYLNCKLSRSAYSGH